MPRASKHKARAQEARDVKVDSRARCEVCQEKEKKYHCPIDRVGYCSVHCFKRHKATSCTSKSISLPNVYTTSGPAPLQVVEDASSTPIEKSSKAMRSLASLSYPPDPLEEGLNALSDPLNRDQPKPLLRNELLAIATSVPLRKMLSTHPYLRDILTTLSRIPNAPPRYPQETRLRNMLGLGELEGIPVQLNYRPAEEADAAAKVGSGSRRVGNICPAPEEKEALRQFNELIKQILREERR